MDWPEFDFDERSCIRRQRLTDSAEPKRTRKSRRFRACRSLTASFENSKFKRKKAENGSEQSSRADLCGRYSPSRSTPVLWQRRSVHTESEADPKALPPLSPILVNGFFMSPSSLACASALTRNEDVERETQSTTSTKLSDPRNFISEHSGNPASSTPEKTAHSRQCTIELFSATLSPVFPLTSTTIVPESSTSGSGRCAPTRNREKMVGRFSSHTPEKTESRELRSEGPLRSPQSASTRGDCFSCSGSSTLFETRPPSPSEFGKLRENNSERGKDEYTLALPLSAAIHENCPSCSEPSTLSATLPPVPDQFAKSQGSRSSLDVCGHCDNEKEDESFDEPFRSPQLAAIPEDRVSLSSSSTLLETLPPSPSQFGKSQDGRYFSDISERCVASQPEGFESEKVITVRRARSDSDVFQDSPSVSTSGDQLNDSLLDVTIHETQEPNDSACEAGGPDQSANVAPLTAGDLWETAEGEAGAGQKHHHRLSRLAEALKKRMAIKCSDLAMWKREPQSQQPVHKITLSSVTEQWGICWSMGRCMADLADVHIIDSEPLRKLEVISAKSKNHKENENESTEAATSSQHSEHMLPDVYTLYHPLPKLNIQIGEVFLAPRYYR